MVANNMSDACRVITFWRFVPTKVRTRGICGAYTTQAPTKFIALRECVFRNGFHALTLGNPKEIVDK
jgi:hypothetical protein